MLSNPTKAKIAVPKYSASYLIEVLPELYIDEPSKRSLVTLRTFLSSRISPHNLPRVDQHREVETTTSTCNLIPSSS